MGKDYTPVKLNNYELKPIFNYLKKFEVVEASEEKYFNKQFSFLDVDEIELGYAGTEESIIRLKNGGFIVINKTMSKRRLALMKAQRDIRDNF